jgi:hypothetical protein
MQNYQKRITLSASATQTYAAITEHIADWWTNDFSGTSSRKSETFKIAFNNTRKTIAIVEAIPDERIVWECTEAYIDMAALKNKAEWVGTKMIWTISPSENGSILNFLHEGLNESFECYEICEQGWDMFLSSLESYLNTGKGTPFLKKPGN